jgi:hypothetical protein
VIASEYSPLEDSVSIDPSVAAFHDPTIAGSGSTGFGVDEHAPSSAITGQATRAILMPTSLAAR